MLSFRDFFIMHGLADQSPRVLKPFHDQILTAMARVVVGDLPDGKKNLMINMPPRHGKTFLARALVGRAVALRRGAGPRRGLPVRPAAQLRRPRAFGPRTAGAERDEVPVAADCLPVADGVVRDSAGFDSAEAAGEVVAAAFVSLGKSYRAT